MYQLKKNKIKTHLILQNKLRINLNKAKIFLKKKKRKNKIKNKMKANKMRKIKS